MFSRSQNKIKTTSTAQSISLTLSLLFDKLKILKELHQIKVFQYQEFKRGQMDQEGSFLSFGKAKEEELLAALLEVASRISKITVDANNQKMHKKTIDVLSSIGNINLPYQLPNSQSQLFSHESPSPLQTSYSVDNSQMSEESTSRVNPLIRDSTEESDSLDCELINSQSGEGLAFEKGKSNSSCISHQTNIGKPRILESPLMNSIHYEGEVRVMSNSPLMNTQQEMQIPSNQSPLDVELLKDFFPDQSLLLQQDKDFLSECYGF